MPERGSETVMKSCKRTLRRKAVALLCTMGFVCQLGSCDLGQITTTSTVTLDGRQVIIDLIRGAILTPLDQFITDTINDAFDNDDD